MGGRGEVLRDTRIEHLNAFQNRGIDAYPAEPPTITHTISEMVSSYEQLEGVSVATAGRITAIRDHGGLMFWDVQGPRSKIQLMIARKEEGDEAFDFASHTFDPGDFIGVSGVLGKTKKGEITIRTDADSITMLAKAILPPPSGRFGVEDPETARSQRYLETMANPKARERFIMRSKMVQMMREDFLQRGFLEVETPVLDTTYGGANAKPFETHMKNKEIDANMYLKISPELYLKRLTVGMMGPVFEFSRNFRNEGRDKTHNPEFTTVEAYLPYADYETMMQLMETMFERIALSLLGTTQVKFGEHVVDFKAPWKRITIYDGLKSAYRIDPTSMSDEDVKKLGENEGVAEAESRRGDILLALFEKAHDGKLIQPTFVMDYPKETSPLTKQHRKDPNLVERFECYVGGWEVANAYTELNNPLDQRDRFEDQARRKEGGDEEAMPMDDDFITALEYGMPPQGGIGISIDRMAMILTDTHHIRDIILFPQMNRQ